MEQANQSAPDEVPAQSPSMFQGATRFGIGGSQLVNVQGDMNVHPTVPLPTSSGPQQEWHAPQTIVPNPPPPPRQTVYSESGNYTNQLLCQGRGFPLYIPKPPGNLPAQYRRKGVAIGDVGTVTAEGVFDFFFNIYLPADDPINEDIPEDFVALPPYREKDVIYDHIDPGDYVASPSIHEIGDDFSEPETGGNFVFDCQGPNGAVLALPHGARAEKLRNLENVRQYATRHAESWYKYANKTRGRGLVNGSLYLVTGCEKARSWGMASFHNVSLPGENGFSLSFKPTTDANNGYRYRWKGPYCRRKQADSVGTRLNQTTFIHAFTISLSETIWGSFFGGVKVSPLVDTSTFPTMSGRDFVPYGSQGTSFILSFFRGSASGGGKSYTGRAPTHENVIISDASPIPLVFHPSQIIHDRLLREFPQAAVVITHDDDWREILRADGIRTSGQSHSVLQQAIFDRCEIMEENGAVFLKTKSEFLQRENEAISLTRDIDLPPQASSADDASSTDDPTVLDISGLELSSKLGDEKGARYGVSRDDTTETFQAHSGKDRSTLNELHNKQLSDMVVSNQADLEQVEEDAVPTGTAASADNVSITVEDAPSPTSSIPSSPTHSGRGPYSLVPLWAAGDFLDIPTAMCRPHPQASRGSNTSSIESSCPNLDWSGSTSSGPELYEPQDNSLHPPMPLHWDQNNLTPTSTMMYRHGNAPFLLSLDTSSIASPGPSTYWEDAMYRDDNGSSFGSDASSIASPGPSTDWEDAVPFYSEVLALGTETNGQDEDSPKTNSSDETERAASRMGDDFAQKLQLQDGNAYYTTSFSSPAFRMSAGGGPTGLGDMPTDHHRDNMTLFGTERQISEFGGESGAFRPVVSTEAGRIASKIRRKGEARFFCSICPADFTAKHNLRNHMKSHQSIKDFFCNMCGKGFGTKHVLERHKPKCNSRPSAPRRSFEAAA